VRCHSVHTNFKWHILTVFDVVHDVAIISWSVGGIQINDSLETLNPFISNPPSPIVQWECHVCSFFVIYFWRPFINQSNFAHSWCCSTISLFVLPPPWQQVLNHIAMRITTRCAPVGYEAIKRQDSQPEAVRRFALGLRSAMRKM
jgi:hypothetical protein